MPTSFPGSNDSFLEPAAPSSTALNADGGSGREHDENHQDIVDAVAAMQAEATLLAHSHDGSTARHGSKLAQANTHESPDTDSATTSIHHTIDVSLTEPNKAAAANHSHGSSNPWPVGCIFISEVSTNPATLGLPGTWTAITSAFLVAAGSTFTAGATGGATTHSHTHGTSSSGSHTHTPSVNVVDLNHYHTYDGGIGYATFGHYHYMGAGTGSVVYVLDSGGNSATSAGHEHDGEISSGSNHTHSPPGNSDWGGHHSHGTSASSTNSSHSHTVAASSSESNLPAYLPVYVWYRSA